MRPAAIVSEFSC